MCPTWAKTENVLSQLLFMMQFLCKWEQHANKTQHVRIPWQTLLKKKTFSTCFPGKAFCILCYEFRHRREHFQELWKELNMEQVQPVFERIARSVTPLWRTGKRTLGQGEENPMYDLRVWGEVFPDLLLTDNMTVHSWQTHAANRRRTKRILERSCWLVEGAVMLLPH